MASTLWTQNSKEASNSHLPTLPCKQLLYRARKIGTNLAAAAAKSLQSCLTLRPHRRQLTRLPHPWDSPRKNTKVDCHFLLQCMKVKSESEVAKLCLTLSDLMDCSLPGSSIHGIFQARVLEWGAIAFSNGKEGGSQIRFFITQQCNKI